MTENVALELNLNHLNVSKQMTYSVDYDNDIFVIL